jgi:hypothetical protein
MILEVSSNLIEDIRERVVELEINPVVIDRPRDRPGLTQ